MKTSVYLIEIPAQIPAAGRESVSFPRLAAGWGFDSEGRWRSRPPAQGAAGLVVDDRFLPSPQGMEAARRNLEPWKGALIFDLERPVGAPWEALLRALAGKDTVVPPQYAHCPHGAVLVGPYLPGQSFFPWLEAQRRRWGPLVLDGAPLRHRAGPGRPPVPWAGALPEEGYYCPGALCRHRRLEDGSILFWDDGESLRTRAGAAGVPVLLWAGET